MTQQVRDHSSGLDSCCGMGLIPSPGLPHASGVAKKKKKKKAKQRVFFGGGGKRSVRFKGTKHSLCHCWLEDGKWVHDKEFSRLPEAESGLWLTASKQTGS